MLPSDLQNISAANGNGSITLQENIAGSIISTSIVNVFEVINAPMASVSSIGINLENSFINAVGRVPYSIDRENTTGPCSLNICGADISAALYSSAKPFSIILDERAKNTTRALAENAQNISFTVKLEGNEAIVTSIELNRDTGITSVTIDRAAIENIIITYNPPIIAASLEGSAIRAESLLREGIDVNTVATNGVTPLLAAISYNREKVADLLLKHGANVHIRNKENKSAIEIAVAKNLMDMALKLVIHGVNLQDIGQAILKKSDLLSFFSKIAHKQHDSVLEEYVAKFEAPTKKLNTLEKVKIFNIAEFIKEKLPLFLSEMFNVTIEDDGYAIAPKVLSLKSIAMKNLLKNLPENLEKQHVKALLVAAGNEAPVHEEASMVPHTISVDNVPLSGEEGDNSL